MGVEENEDMSSYGEIDDHIASQEQMALSQFAYCLGSCNFMEEPGNANDRNTRLEAKLLMSLHSSPEKFNGEDLELISTSGSERSYLSDSSTHTRKEAFTFTCPSLSLEHSKRVSFAPRSRCRRENCAEENTMPAALLARPLRVDDRDATRLSADAMARNLLQSYQKALEWRIQTWIRSTSSIIFKKEREMLAKGATEVELKSLLDAPEANLLLLLKSVSKEIAVIGAYTSFRVLPEIVDVEAEPLPKKRRVSNEESSSTDGEDSEFSVGHSLLLLCAVNLQTPAGFSEVTLRVPGVIHGVFRDEDGEEELSSVLVTLETDILAAMIEKSCRKIVRASVEALSEPGESTIDDEEPEISRSVVPNSSLFLSPPREQTKAPNANTSSLRAAAIVTPRHGFQDIEHRNPRTLLFPIPDELEEKKMEARRISPQPHSPHVMGPITMFTPTKHGHNGPSLISPPLNESSRQYHEVAENGPSLPMLVEVACRQMDPKFGHSFTRA